MPASYNVEFRSAPPSPADRAGKFADEKRAQKIGAGAAQRSEYFSRLFLLVILLLRVDAPERCLIDMSGHNTIHRSHRGQHAVVLIVVLMHSVPAHKKQ